MNTPNLHFSSLRSPGYFILRRYGILPFLIILLFFGHCNLGDDNEDPREKSQRLRSEVAELMSQREYSRAEESLSEVLLLDAGLQQPDKLAGDRFTAAKVEYSLGFFSRSIENYTHALQYYRESGDHATEVLILNALGNLHIGLGEFETGIGLLTDAWGASKVSTAGDAETAMNLGNAYALTGQYEKALEQYTTAASLYAGRNYAPTTARALSRVGYISARLGMRNEALATYATVENLVGSSVNVLVKGRFYYDRGKTYELLGEWSAAAQSFRDAIGMLEDLPRSGKNEETGALLTLLYTALGKVYSHNFTYLPAKESYIEAYTLAKDLGNKTAVGYLLIAIADCERKLAAVKPTQEASIAASTYYEQAATLFSRTGNIDGEAYGYYKLGSLKDEEGNIDAALTFYRRSFELRSAQEGEFRERNDDTEFIELRDGASLEGIPFSADTYWYEPLTVALALRGRAAEALSVFEQGKVKNLSPMLRSIPFDWKDRALQQSLQSLLVKRNEVGIKEAEYGYQRGLDTKHRDAEHIAQLQRDLSAEKNELQSAAFSLSQQYPRLEALVRTPPIQEGDLRAALSYGTMVLDYAITENRILIFVVTFDGPGRQGPIGVLEVPVYKDIVMEKVQRFGMMLREGIYSIGTGYTQRTDIERLSEELYNYFLRPVERLFVQRVVIVPPREMEGIPFHAFTRRTNEGTKSLIELQDVSYLPYLSAVKALQPAPRYTNAVVVVGNPRGNNWPLDFELRDVRSFFRNATVSVSQNANDRQLFESSGDVLQLSTEFNTDTLFPGRSTFILSSGSITNPGANIPIADLSKLHPYPIVYLSDQQSSGSGLTPLYASVLMLNGSSYVILNLRPSEAKVNKIFSERFYSSLAKGMSVNDSYRTAVEGLSRSKDFSSPHAWSQFFKFGR